MRCPFKTGNKYCTHIANGNRTKSNKGSCIYKESKCPYLKEMKYILNEEVIEYVLNKKVSKKGSNELQQALQKRYKKNVILNSKK